MIPFLVPVPFDILGEGGCGVIMRTMFALSGQIPHGDDFYQAVVEFKRQLRLKCRGKEVLPFETLPSTPHELPKTIFENLLSWFPMFFFHDSYLTFKGSFSNVPVKVDWFSLTHALKFLIYYIYICACWYFVEDQSHTSWQTFLFWMQGMSMENRRPQC